MLLLIRPGVPVFLLALAIIRAGGVEVIVDIAMGQEAFRSRVKLAAPRWIFAESLLLALQQRPAARRVLRARGVEIPELGGFAGARTVVTGPWLPGLPAGHLALRDLLRPAGRAAPWDEASLDPDEDMLIVFTSGTTAAPKGVVHTHATMGAALDMLLAHMPAQPGDVFYASVLHIVVPALCRGARTILAPARFSAHRALEHLQRYRVSKTFATPSEYEEVIAVCRAAARMLPTTLDTIMLGSAPAGPGFLRRLQAILPPRTAVWSAYGMTEMLPICAVSLEEKLDFADAGDLVGRPLPGVTVALAADGELVISGPNLFRRLLGGVPVQEYATGDMARLDDQGRVILLGRKKDMIIKKGHNIYPGMIEPTIQRIAGVQNCALVGSYNPATSDEEIVLVVEKDDPRDEPTYRRYLAAALLSGPHSIDVYAQPDRIVFARLPTAGRSRKVDKQKLRAMVAARGEQP